MKVSELKNIKLTKELAYVIGLVYPLNKSTEYNNRSYLVGPINYNAIDDDDLTNHFLKINDLIKEITPSPKLYSNKTSNRTISNKKGFSILLEKNLDTKKCDEILTNIVKEILHHDSDEIRRYFIIGCFDGRSSWDRTAHYISIDVDRDYEKQDLIELIANSFNIELNKNRRAKDHNKNDQLRIKKKSLNLFLSKIGFLSRHRKNLIENELNNI